MVLHMWTKFCSCTHGKKITLSDSKDHCLSQFIASYLIFAVKTCYFLSSQVSSQVWCFPFVFPSPQQDCFASSCLFRCLRPCFELDFSKCFSLPVLLCRRWFGFLLTFHSVMKSSGSSRLAQKTLTLQKSKCCDGFPVLLRSFWLAGRKRSFGFITAVGVGTDFVAFKHYLENAQQLRTTRSGVWSTGESSNPQTQFSAILRPPLHCFLLMVLMKEPPLACRFYLIIITKESFSSQKHWLSSRGEILPVSTWFIITSCCFKCTPAQRYLVIWRERDRGPDPKLSLESLFFLSRKPKKGWEKSSHWTRNRIVAFTLEQTGWFMLMQSGFRGLIYPGKVLAGGYLQATVLPCLIFPFLLHTEQDIFYCAPQ